MTRWIWNRTQGIVTDFSGYTLADHLTMDARREELKAIAAGCRCVASIVGAGEGPWMAT